MANASSRGSEAYIEAECFHSDNLKVIDAFLEERAELMNGIRICEQSKAMYHRLIFAAERRVKKLGEIEVAK